MAHFSEELLIEISNIFPCVHPPEDTQFCKCREKWEVLADTITELVLEILGYGNKVREEENHCSCPEYQHPGNTLPGFSFEFFKKYGITNNLVGHSDLSYPNYCCGKCLKVRKEPKC